MSVGRPASWFDVAYVGVMLDWVLFVVVWPLWLVLTLTLTNAGIVATLSAFLIGYFAWSAVGAIVLRR